MRKILFILFLAVFLIGNVSAVTYLYEYYNVSAETVNAVDTISWASQTFTVGTVGINAAHTPINITLNLSRIATSPGTATLSLRDVASNGKPTGADLCSGTTDATTLIQSTTQGDLRNITLSSCGNLAPSTQYAFVIRTDGGTNGLRIYGVVTGATYPGGNVSYSTDSGANWLSMGPGVGYDWQFFEWSSTAPVAPLSLKTKLILPINNTQTSNTSLLFNSSLVPTSGNLTNATIYIWNASGYNVNKTTNILTGNVENSTVWNISNFQLASVYHWNVYGCAANLTGYICAWNSTNFTFTSSAFSELVTTYNISVLETSRQTFEINISGNPSINSASALFWYNGTNYSAVVTDGTGGIYKVKSSFDIPLAEATGNKTFYWDWSFTLTGGAVVKQTTITYSHQVNRTYLIYCNATYNNQFINFTTKSATNPFPNVNATFKSSWNHWIGMGNAKRNYSFEDVTETMKNWTFCGSPAYETFKANANIEYDASHFAQNFYYIENATLTNATNAINLYLLNDTLATVTELVTWDNAQNPIANVLIQIQLYDIGTDTYYTVGMGKTSFEGKDVAYLNWYSTLYKFIFIRDGVVVKITEPFKIASTPQTFTISDVVTYSFDKFRDFVYSLSYNNATNNFVLTFTKPSGLVDQGCLRVTKRTAYNDTEICLTCESSSSATIYCNIGSSGNGTFIATFYATGSWYLLDWIEEKIGGTFAESIYELLGNDDATAYAFFFSGIVVSMFFLSPVLAIVGLMLGILGGAALGFTILNYTEFLGIVVIGGIIIWFVKR